MIDNILIVDAHVHCHPTAKPGALLHAAATNFGAMAQTLCAQRWQGVLMLTEMPGANWFESLLNACSDGMLDGWKVSAVPGEAHSLYVHRDQLSLLVVAGRQIVTAEGLEVLALGTRQLIADGLSLPDTLSQVRKSGAVTILPWGAGKWLGRRGKLVMDAIGAADAAGRVFVGDNSGRPVFWPAPSVFALAASRGCPILSGTDPLPLPDEENRVGRCGFWLSASLASDTPAASLTNTLLAATADEVHAYGARESTWRFVCNQLALRFNKRPRLGA